MIARAALAFFATTLFACSTPDPAGTDSGEWSTGQDHEGPVREQDSDTPTGQWMLATDGCGLDAIVRAAEAAERPEEPDEWAGEPGTAGPNAPVDAGMAASDTSAPYDTGATYDAGGTWDASGTSDGTPLARIDHGSQAAGA